MRFEIRVYGQPAPQGSKRALGKRGGKHIMVESSKDVRPWREAVKAAARAFIDANSEFKRFEGPVQYTMMFFFIRPKSVSAKKRPYHMTKPDTSKLQRATEDALTDAGVWRDDAQCFNVTALKHYISDDVSAGPGAFILVEEPDPLF